jgi:ADP-heptose:LPS heptosyltransferase
LIGSDSESVRLLRDATRVLIVRVDDLGDNVIASGFPSAVAKSIPGACGFIGPTSVAQLMDLTGLAFVAGADGRPRTFRDVLASGRRLRASVRQFDPDVVLLPRFDFEREAVAIALLGSYSRRTITWARDATSKRNRRSWWLSFLPGPRISADGAPAHEFGRLQHFAARIGVDADRLFPAIDVEAVALPQLADVPGRPVAVAIGAANARRWWPLEHFAAVIGTLSKSGYTSVLLGSPDEVERGQQLASHLPNDARVVDLIGRIPLPEVAAVIKECVLFIGNDSGLGHVAAGVGTPAVVVSCHPVGAPADHVNAPERFQPIGRSLVVRPVSPTSEACAKGCLPTDEACCIKRVAVDEVLQACWTMMAEPSATLTHEA